MVDFANLETLHVTDKTARYIVDRLIGADPSKPVVIIGRPASRDNKPYWREYMKRMGGKTRSMRRGRVSAEVLEGQIAVLKIVLPKYVFVGWENMPEASGGEVPFSVENAMQFCKKVPDTTIADMLDFFESDVSFVEDDEEDEDGDSAHIDVEEVAGN